jgi:hypothetical protein
MIRTLAAAAAAFSLLAAPVAAPAQQGFPKQMPATGTPKPFRVPASESFTLPNGMQVTLIPYGITPTAVVSLRVYAGALNQGDDIWLPLLTAQMLREGAAGRTGAQIAEQAASLGGNLGVGAGTHETSMTLNVLSEHAPAAVRLIADVARRPDFPQAELERVRAGLLRNLAVARTTPGSSADAALSAAYYGDKHPYGRLFPTEAQLKNYGIGDVRRFYASNYGAQRARLYVAGRFDALRCARRSSRPMPIGRRVRSAFASRPSRSRARAWCWWIGPARRNPPSASPSPRRPPARPATSRCASPTPCSAAPSIRASPPTSGKRRAIPIRLSPTPTSIPARRSGPSTRT